MATAFERRGLPYLALLCCAATMAGCDPPETNASAAPSASSAAMPAEAPAQPLVMDSVVVTHLEAIVAKCSINETDGGIEDCPEGESRKLFDYARDEKPPHVLETLAEMAVTKGGKDKKVLSAAVGMMRWMCVDLDRGWVASNATPAAAERVVKLVATVPDDYWLIFPTVGAGIPVLAGRVAELEAAIAKLEPDSRFKSSLYQHFVEWGGSAVLPTMEKLTKSSNPELRRAATFGVSVAMYQPKLSEAEQKKICDWAKGFLAHEDLSVSAGAADAMTRCKGEYIDAALDALEGRIAKGPLAQGWVGVAHHLCWSEGVVGGAVNGSPEQCKRALALSDQALQNRELVGEDRRVVVFGLGLIARNGNLHDQGRTLLQKYVADFDTAAAEQAKSSLQQL